MTQLTADAPDLSAADTSKWWIPVVLGALSILVGFLALVWPGATLLVTGILFVTGKMSAISYWLLETFPVFQSIG